MRHDGEIQDPQLVWMDLLQDIKHGWINADPFRQWLALELEDILPSGGRGSDDRSERELLRTRLDAGKELVALIKKWMATANPAIAE
ncbi:MAG: hypothetical protein ABSA65_13295 [Acidimicrobiales bacterium]|jgi:hypothetical protein